MASGDTKTNQYLDIAANGSRADLPTDTCCETRSQTLIRGVAERIMDVEDEVERLENNPDVADIVATYADLQAYDTSQLTDKDVIRVLQDETHDGDSTYYRWSTSTQTWTYIGESKQYTDFVGTDGTAAGEAGLVPAPATTDAGKFLKADGTWDEAGGGTLYNTTGTNTDGAMTQKATTEMVFADPSTKKAIRIGDTSISSNNGIAIGYNSRANGNNRIAIGDAAQAQYADETIAIGPSSKGYGRYSVAIGRGASAQLYGVAIGGDSSYGAEAQSNASIAIGAGARASGAGAIALGYYARTGITGEMAIGTTDTNYGYNGSAYRKISGVYDGENAHDAATVGQLPAVFTNAEFNQIFGTSLQEEL